MDDETELLVSLTQELRRGTLILSVLSQLSEPRYGYALVQRLQERGVTIDPGTLYPLLRRLEKQGMLCSEWDTTEAKPRKYYRRTRLGERIYGQLRKQFQDLAADLARMFVEGQP